MRKLYKMLTVMTVILGVLISSSLAQIYGESIFNAKTPSSELSEILKVWIVKNEEQSYKDITVVVTPLDIKIKDNSIEGIFSVTVSEVLKANSPEELPMIKGMKKFLDEERGSLTQRQIEAVNYEISQWLASTAGYIGKTQTSNFDIKVVANISEDGSILQETTSFFMSDGQGGFYKVDRLVETAEQMEAEGFKHAKEIAEKATGEIILDINTLSFELSNALKEQLVKNYSQYYKDINIDLSLIPDSVTIKDKVISAVFNATIDMTLKEDKVEDIPYMKGMLDYYNSRKSTLSSAQIEAANKMINDSKSELEGYIGKQTIHTTFKATANILDTGDIDKNSVAFYIEDQSSTGNGDKFSPVPTEMFQTAEDMEKNGAEEMKKVIEEAATQPAIAKSSFNKSILIIIFVSIVVAVIIVIVILLRRKRVHIMN